MPQFQEPSHWTPVLVEQHIDPILLNEKRLEISSALQEKRRSAMAEAKNDHQRANAAILLADEYAEKLFAGYLEIWDLQGLPRSHALYEAIYVAIRQGLGGSNSAFVGEFTQLALIRRRPPDSSTLRWFKREMDKLASKWNHRINAESRRCMYAARREAQMTRGAVPKFSALQNPEQVGAVTSTFSWKELEARFLEIQASATRQEVRIWFTRTEWQSGSVTTHFLPGGRSALQRSFESLGSVAARKLGHSSSEGAHEYWLNRVMEWVRETGLDRDRSFFQYAVGPINQPAAGTEHSLHTERIADLSAKFCIELNARGTPESAASPASGLAIPKSLQSVAVSPAVPSNKRQASWKPKVLTSPERKRQRVIFGAIEAGLKGRKYCAQLKSESLLTPAKWHVEGCPASYRDAYQDPKWKPRIWDEKNRFQERYDATPPAERTAIIEGRDGTRRTR